MARHARGGQRQLGSLLYPFSTWVLGNKLSSSPLVASAFTHRTISLVLYEES